MNNSNHFKAATPTAHIADADLVALAGTLDALGNSERDAMPDDLYQRLMASVPQAGAASNAPKLVLHSASVVRQESHAELSVRRRSFGTTWFAAAACLGLAAAAWLITIATPTAGLNNSGTIATTDSTATNPLASGVAVASGIDSSLNVELFDAAVAESDSLALSLESDIEAIGTILGNDSSSGASNSHGM